MTRGIAPLILGYQAFDADIQIAGVILNQLGGSRHESKLRSVIEHYTDVNVVGAVYRNKDMSIEERHLGLMPSNEDDSADKKIDQIRDLLKQQVDLDKIKSIAATAGELPSYPPHSLATKSKKISVSALLKMMLLDFIIQVIYRHWKMPVLTSYLLTPFVISHWQTLMVCSLAAASPKHAWMN